MDTSELCGRMEVFLTDTFSNGKSAIVEMDGSFDSKFNILVLSKFVGKEKITPVIFKDDPNLSSSVSFLQSCDITNQIILDIEPVVEEVTELVGDCINDKVKDLLVSSLAKAKDAMVIGNKNKSDSFLCDFKKGISSFGDCTFTASVKRTEMTDILKYIETPEDIFNASGGNNSNSKFGFPYEEIDKVLDGETTKNKDEILAKSKANVDALGVKVFTLDE